MTIIDVLNEVIAHGKEIPSTIHSDVDIENEDIIEHKSNTITYEAMKLKYVFLEFQHMIL